MTKQAGNDDLEAVRSIVETLEPFSLDDRQRILRWVQEKLGMVSPLSSILPGTGPGPAVRSPIETKAPAQTSRQIKDIKSFVAEKNPASDRQLAAVVAYFYAFEASPEERKDAIGADDLIDACRKAGRRRPKDPGQTLRNAAHSGLLDKASERGRYKLNAVGENLVAMVLGTASGSKRPPKVASKRKKQKNR